MWAMCKCITPCYVPQFLPGILRFDRRTRAGVSLVSPTRTQDGSGRCALWVGSGRCGLQVGSARP
eukprot:1148470-Pelagomonas_calceolata.AAC.8